MVFDGMRVLNLNSKEYSVLHWLAILADNRTYWKKSSIAEENKKYLKEKFLIDISEYDVIIGYRADDSYFTYANNFVNNAISLNQLEKAMKLGNLGEQIVLKSERAFKQIHFVDFEQAPVEVYYNKKIMRERDINKTSAETLNKLSKALHCKMEDLLDK